MLIHFSINTKISYNFYYINPTFVNYVNFPKKNCSCQQNLIILQTRNLFHIQSIKLINLSIIYHFDNDYYHIVDLQLFLLWCTILFCIFIM